MNRIGTGQYKCMESQFIALLLLENFSLDCGVTDRDDTEL